MDILWPWGTGVGIGTISGAVLMRYCPRASPIVLRKASTVSSLSTAYLSVSVWFTTFSRISGSTCAESRHTCSALLSSHNRIQANNGPPLPPIFIQKSVPISWLKFNSRTLMVNRHHYHWWLWQVVDDSVTGFLDQNSYDYIKKLLNRWLWFSKDESVIPLKFLRVNWKNAL